MTKNMKAQNSVEAPAGQPANRPMTYGELIVAPQQAPPPPPANGQPDTLVRRALAAAGAYQPRPPASISGPLALTVEEAAVALNVSTKTIRRLLDRGILTASKALRKKLIPRSQIEGFLKATCDAPKSIL